MTAPVVHHSEQTRQSPTESTSADCGVSPTNDGLVCALAFRAPVVSPRLPTVDTGNNGARSPDTAAMRCEVFMRIRVVIADDSPHGLAALRALLVTWPACEVVGEAVSGQAALTLIEERLPDLALLDARMPVLDGLATTRLIKARWPAIKVIVISIDERYRGDADTAGADAFVAKSAVAERLLPLMGNLCAPSGG